MFQCAPASRSGVDVIREVLLADSSYPWAALESGFLALQDTWDRHDDDDAEEEDDDDHDDFDLDLDDDDDEDGDDGDDGDDDEDEEADDDDEEDEELARQILTSHFGRIH